VQPALLMALVASSYLLLAGATAWSRLVLLGLTALAALAAPRRTFSFPRSDRSLDLALAGITAAMFLQIVPLPGAIVDILAPHARPVQSATHLRVGDPGGWATLSIDPAATRQAIITMAMTIVVFWIARGLFSAGGFTRHYCRLLGWLGAALAVVAIVQKAVAPGLLMGTVVSGVRNANPIGPFLNRNHFAAWLLMTTAASIGYLIAHLQIHPSYRQRLWLALKHFMTSGAMLSGICALVMVVAILMTLSRSAAVGLGAAALVGGWLGRGRLRVERTGMPAVLGAAGVALLVLAASLDIQGWYTRAMQSVGGGVEFDRLTIWRESAAIMRDFPVTGTGAGTYALAMSHYQQTQLWIGAMQAWAHFNNAHSQYVQALVEGGLLLTAPVALASGLLIRLGLQSIRTDKGEMFWIRIGAAAGIAGIAVQSLWEIALVMPANAILFATLAGLLVYRREGSRPPTTDLLRPA
jgi:O-antigen ligase